MRIKSILCCLAITIPGVFSANAQNNDPILEWDPGATPEGDLRLSLDNISGPNYFRINTRASLNGGWRTVLKVTSGEANIYLSKEDRPMPTENGNERFSARVGNDGWVVRADEYTAGETWFLLVDVPSGTANCELLTGEVYVQDLGELQFTDNNGNEAYDEGEPIIESGSDPVTIGPEGAYYFKGSVPAGTPAWRLWTNDGNADQTIAVRTGSVPFLSASRYYNKRRDGALLLVPPFLGQGAEAYFIGFEGEPGETITLDSRIHEVEPIPFETSLSNISVSGFPYRTFRISVPEDSFAWDVAISPTQGNPDLAVRRGEIGTEIDNDAFSEGEGDSSDSITIAPPALGEGFWYVTLYGDAPFTCDMTSGEVTITSRPFLGTLVNDRPNRVGWRYYVVSDIESQEGNLGWELLLEDAPEGSEIALRRNAVPGSWNFRSSGNNPTASSRRSRNIDFSSTSDLLQRPRHQADIWYVGVFSPEEALGEFSLEQRLITPRALTADGGGTAVMGHGPNQWKFFRVDVPLGFLGWDVALADNAAGLRLRLAVSKNLLPDIATTRGWASGGPSAQTSWPSGAIWGPGADWTNRTQIDSKTISSQRLMSAFGAPLEAGTYFVGVLNTDNNATYDYDIGSRLIGTVTSGASVPVTDLSFENGTATINSLPVSEAAYYRVTVPSGALAWKATLSVDDPAETMFTIRKGALPDFNSRFSGDAAESGGIAIQSAGGEFYNRLAPDQNPEVEPGDYYIAVVGEGESPDSRSRYGTGDITAILTSEGVPDIATPGPLANSQIRLPFAIAGEDIQLVSLAASASTAAFDFRLENVDGEISFTAREGINFPEPNVIGSRNGWDGGWEADLKPKRAGAFANTGGKTYTFSLHGLEESTGELVITPRFPALVDFDGGIASISGQLQGTWRFFQVEVPEDFLAWDVRIRDASGGHPRIVVSRDLIPNEIDTTFSGSPSDRTEWDSGLFWTEETDWTGRKVTSEPEDVQHRRLVSATGKPLTPGTYFIGVENFEEDDETDGTTSYTFESRGIGAAGSGATFEVTDLDFNGGTMTVPDLPALEASYFRVTVPAGASSWRIRAAAAVNDCLMVVRKDFIPDFTAKDNLDADRRGGVNMFQENNEWYHLLPRQAGGTIDAGDYYIAVFNDSEIGAPGGGLTSFEITSIGEIPIKDLGTATETTIVEPLDVEAGEIRYFSFEVTPGSSNLTVSILDIVDGVFHFNVEDSLAHIAPYPPSIPYGYDKGAPSRGGVSSAEGASSAGLIFPTPVAGIWTVAVRSFPAETGELRIRVDGGLRKLAFDGGSSSVFNQSPGTWVFFCVDVPADGFIGWDLDLINDSGGDPQIVVRSGALPSSPPRTSGWPTGGPSEQTEWPDLAQWAPTSDWTGRQNDPMSQRRGGGRFIAAFGKPLQPQRYFIGVNNKARIGQLDSFASYTLRSRGIGTQDSTASIRVTPIASENGSVSLEDLPVREAAYFSTTIPGGLPSWRCRLGNQLGESMLAGRAGFIPDLEGSRDGDISVKGGIRVSKDSDEWYNLLPAEGQPTIPGGLYYFAAVGEGVNPPNRNTAGTGGISATFSTLGATPVTNIGMVGVDPLVNSYSLQGGELGLVNLIVPSGVETLELRLENRVNNPGFSVVPGLLSPDAGGTDRFSYGYDGGVTPVGRSLQILSLVAPPAGPLSLTLNTEEPSNGSILPASADLQVRTVPATPLAFAPGIAGTLPNSDTDSLLDKQIKVYSVDVPPTLPGGQVILGWKISTNASSGSPIIRAYPEFADRENGPEFEGRVATLAPPYFIPGRTWRFEIQGDGLTNYTVTSEAVTLELAPWIMPIGFNQNFGDSGTGLPGDGGRDLGADDWDFYAIDVPPSNAALLRTVLEAINGTPGLYIRTDAIPAPGHTATGKLPRTGTNRLVERQLLGDETLYGNWVPIDGRNETVLAPGRWYLGVHAENDNNARYRIRVSTGTVDDIQIGDSVTGQTLVDSDWRYYRFDLPEDAPESVSVNVTRNGGDVFLYVRDTSPPGLGIEGISTSDTVVVNSDDDEKNQGPYNRNGWNEFEPLTLGTPPLRPGSTYFIGVRADADANFDLSLSASGNTIGSIPEVDFFGGSLTGTLEPGETTLFLVNAPENARLWSHTTEKARGVELRLEQGTIPNTEGSSHYRDSGNPDTSFERNLTASGWPWVPGQTYYVRLTNTTDTAQPFVFMMTTPQGDGDVLPDDWEQDNFGNLDQLPEDDPNGDGLNNFLSYSLDIDPVNGISSSSANPLPLFQWSVIGTRGGVTIGLDNPRNNIRYIIQRNFDLSEAGWTEIARKNGTGAWDNPVVSVDPTTNRTFIPDAADADSSVRVFYRLQVEPINP